MQLTTNSSFPKAQPTNPRPGKQSLRCLRHAVAVEVGVSLSPWQGGPIRGGRQRESRGWMRISCQRRGRSGGGETDHPELGQQGHAEEGQVVEDEADAVGLAQLEALCRHRHEGEDQAQPQGPGEDPDQEAVRLQLPERWGVMWSDTGVLRPA